MYIFSKFDRTIFDRSWPRFYNFQVNLTWLSTDIKTVYIRVIII